MKPLSALVRTDLVLYFSNRRALLVTLAAPILIAAFFGAVMGGPPKKPARVPVAVVDLDGSAVTKGIVAAMKGDSTFELREIAEPAAIEEVRTGKLRAAIVLPKGFGEAAPRALFRPGEKPVIVVHIDPSQSVTLSLVKGLLAQHAMQTITRTAFGAGEGGMKVLTDARAEIEGSTTIAETERRDLVAMLDSVARVQSRSTPSTGGTRAGGIEIPFTTQEHEVTAAGVNRKYNG